MGLTSMNRKKHQRKINSVVRRLNKELKEDTLWHGRFVADQVTSSFNFYQNRWIEGCHEYELNVWIRMTDLKTGRTGYVDLQSWDNYLYSKLGWAMNWFIVEYCQIWETEHRDSIYNDRTDYSKIKLKPFHIDDLDHWKIYHW